MSENKCEMKVFVEDLNRVMILSLTPDQAARASIDTVYLQHVVNEELARLQFTQEVNTISTSQTSQPPPAQSCEDIEHSTLKSLFLWNTPCVQLLLTLYEEHQENFNNGATRQKKIWEEIARRMQLVDPTYTMTGTQCQSKLNGLKKTFKKILDHNNKSGNDRATWPFFDRMNEIFGTTGWVQPRALATEAGPTPPACPTTEGTKVPKRNHETAFEKYMAGMKAERQSREEERKRHRSEREIAKEQKLNRLLDMKEQHHKEKMEMLQVMFQATPKDDKK